MSRHPDRKVARQVTALGRKLRERPNPGPEWRVRLATVVSHDADGTMTVDLGGTQIPGVRLGAGPMLPPPGGTVWLAGYRPDLWAIASTDPGVGFSLRADRTTNVTVNSSTDTAITWETTEPTPDPFGAWTGGSTLVAPATGRYRAVGFAVLSGNATGLRYFWIEVNGVVRARDTRNAVANAGVQTDTTVDMPARRLVKGDTVKLWVRQTSGVGLSLTEGRLSLEYLGP